MNRKNVNGSYIPFPIPLFPPVTSIRFIGDDEADMAYVVVKILEKGLQLLYC